MRHGWGRLAGAAALCGLVACKPAAQAEASEEKKAPARPPFIMTCSPEKVGPGDVIRVRFDGAHGGSLMIGGPNGRMFNISTEGWPADDPILPPLSADYVSKSREVEIPVSQVSRMVYDDIDDRPEPMFSESGTYFIAVGRSELPGGSGRLVDAQACSVVYDAELPSEGKNLKRTPPKGWNWVLDDPPEE